MFLLFTVAVAKMIHERIYSILSVDLPHHHCTTHHTRPRSRCTRCPSPNIPRRARTNRHYTCTQVRPASTRRLDRKDSPSSYFLLTPAPTRLYRRIRASRNTRTGTRTSPLCSRRWLQTRHTAVRPDRRPHTHVL